ncbi:MAG: response regulator [Ardenticatenaceae bacterium]|nr:response regulator [Ardenticatenaceae bacterium]HBY96517.1 diguanylate cyclase response regulator [Chloroflexota bacterium]
MRDRPIILVADDDPRMRHVITTVLERAGYEVTSVADGQTALQVVATERPDLILLDVMMPRLNGYEVCTWLRQNLLTATIPIIMLTALDQIHEKVTGIHAGADDYITKPFDSTEFTARIGMHLRRTQRDLSSNPLTTLPGNHAILAAIERRLVAQTPFAVIYIDLNSFKPYNDKYGFIAGDRMINLLATTVIEAITKTGLSGDDFVGHEGGDDFVVLTSPERVEALGNHILTAFSAGALHLFDEIDRTTGGFLARDRFGAEVVLPLTAVAIAATTSRPGQWPSAEALIRHAARVKTHVKRLPPPHFAVDPPVPPGR